MIHNNLAQVFKVGQLLLPWWFAYFERFAKFTGKHLPEAVALRCSLKNVFKFFAKFAGKHLSQSLFLNLSLRPATLLKIRLWHWWFPVNFAKFLRTPLLCNTFDSCFLPTTKLFLVKLQGTILKVGFGEFCEIFQNTFFMELLPTFK